MSVIITGMGMPYRCDECPLVTDNECPLLGIDVDEEDGSRDLRCPLKSVKGLIDKIKSEIEKQENWLFLAGLTTYNVDIAFSSIKSVLTESEDKE